MRRPVGLVGGARARMACRDRGLQHVRATLRAQLLGARERRKPAADQQLVPARAVLIEQQHRLALRIDARAEPRGLDLHQRHEAVHLGLQRRELGENAAEPQRLLAQRRAHPVLARGRRIALVEDQVDDLEHRGEPLGERVAARHLERHARLGSACAWRARCAARRSAPARGTRARSLPWSGRRSAAGSARRAPRYESTGWQEVKMRRRRSSPISSSSAASRSGSIRLIHLAADLLVLALDQLRAPPLVERAVLRGRHQPGGGIVRDALLGPALERDHQRVLREFLGGADVARDARQAGDDFRLLDAPDRVDRLMGVGSHGSRLEQVPPRRQARGHFSAAALRSASPAANWPPTILSMFMNIWMIFAKYGTGPCIDQVTLVESPAGTSVNSAMLCASNGRRKSSLMMTFDGEELDDRHAAAADVLVAVPRIGRAGSGGRGAVGALHGRIDLLERRPDGPLPEIVDERERSFPAAP